MGLSLNRGLAGFESHMGSSPGAEVNDFIRMKLRSKVHEQINQCGLLNSTISAKVLSLVNSELCLKEWAEDN